MPKRGYLQYGVALFTLSSSYRKGCNRTQRVKVSKTDSFRHPDIQIQPHRLSSVATKPSRCAWHHIGDTESGSSQNLGTCFYIQSL